MPAPPIVRADPPAVLAKPGSGMSRGAMIASRCVHGGWLRRQVDRSARPFAADGSAVQPEPLLRRDR